MSLIAEPSKAGPPRIILDRENLYDLYVIKKFSSRKIAKLLFCSKWVVLRCLKDYNIKIRASGSGAEEYLYSDENYFKKWSPSMAWVLGYMASDGFVMARGCGIFFTSVDLELLEFCKKELKTNSEIRYREDYHSKKSGYNIHTLYIPGKELVKDLKNLGIETKKSLVLKFPDYLTEEYFWHFLRGYIDGDGCVYDPKYKIGVNFTGSVSFITTLREILVKRFEKHIQNFRPTGQALSLDVNSMTAYKILKLCYDNSEFALSRKKDRALAAIKLVEERLENRIFCDICIKNKELLPKIQCKACVKLRKHAYFKKNYNPKEKKNL